MNLTENLLGDGWYWAAWAAWMFLFARSVWRAPWRRLGDSTQLNVWLGMVVVLTLVWSLKAGIKPGLDLHMLGATLITLSFGPHLAFVGLSLVTAGVTLNGAGDPFSFAANALMMAGLSVGLSQFYYRLLSGILPRHFFVYIFVNGFFGAALTIISFGFCSTVLLALAGAYEWDYLVSEYLPYFLLLSFSEAWLSGMVITLFVVYRPNWVVTFEDSRYLVGK